MQQIVVKLNISNIANGKCTTLSITDLYTRQDLVYIK